MGALHHYEVSKWGIPFRAGIWNGSCVANGSGKANFQGLGGIWHDRTSLGKEEIRRFGVLDGKRLDARFQDQMRKRRMARYYNKRVDPKALKPGDLVLKQMKPGTMHPGEKFKPNWEGPFVVKKVFSRGGVRLSDLEGNEFSQLINIDRLKRFFV